jgi:hypothetical protein
MVNGWRNVIYVVTGLLALGFAIWGFIVTERGIGSILDTLPLGDDDNALHLVIGVVGLLAAFVDGPLPKVPDRLRPRLPKRKPKPKRERRPSDSKADSKAKSTAKKPESKKPARSARESRRPGRAGPPRDGDDEPR